MNDQSQNPPAGNPPSLVAGIASRLAAIVISLGLLMAILFIAAGRIDWTWAWVYFGISVAIMVVNSTILLRTSPETIAERGRPGNTRIGTRSSARCGAWRNISCCHWWPDWTPGSVELARPAPHGISPERSCMRPGWGFFPGR